MADENDDPFFGRASALYKFFFGDKKLRDAYRAEQKKPHQQGSYLLFRPASFVHPKLVFHSLSTKFIEDSVEGPYEILENWDTFISPYDGKQRCIVFGNKNAREQNLPCNEIVTALWRSRRDPLPEKQVFGTVLLLHGNDALMDAQRAEMNLPV